MKHSRLMVALALIASLSAFTGYAQSNAVTLTLSASRNSGVSGSATLTEANGTVQVMVNLQGMQAGSAHAGHIHQGATCADDRAGKGGGVQYPLPNITADANGKGSASATVTTTLALLTDGKHYINYHEAGVAPIGSGIACADIVAAPASLPTTGDSQDTALPLIAAIGLFALAGTAIRVQRHRA